MAEKSRSSGRDHRTGRDRGTGRDHRADSTASDEDVDTLAARYTGLDGADPSQLSKDLLDTKIMEACARTVVVGIDRGELSLAAALARGAFALIPGPDVPADQQRIAGWVEQADVGPWTAATIGFTDPSQLPQLTVDQVAARAASWRQQLLSVAGHTVAAFDQVVTAAAARKQLAADSGWIWPVLAVLDAADDEDCLKPVPWQAGPWRIPHNERLRPHPDVRLPADVGRRDRRQLAALLTGDATPAVGTFAARLAAGTTALATQGEAVRYDDPAARLRDAAALGYHPGKVAAPGQIIDWLWAAPHRTAPSRLFDLVLVAGEAATCGQVLAAADAAGLLDLPDAAAELPADLPPIEVAENATWN